MGEPESATAGSVGSFAFEGLEPGYRLKFVLKLAVNQILEALQSFARRKVYLRGLSCVLADLNARPLRPRSCQKRVEESEHTAIQGVAGEK